MSMNLNSISVIPALEHYRNQFVIYEECTNMCTLDIGLYDRENQLQLTMENNNGKHIID